MSKVRLSTTNVISETKDLIPHAAEKGNDYLRLVAEATTAQQLPLAQDVGPVIMGGSAFRPIEQVCLIQTPEDRRIRAYKFVHFATPMGVNLQFGFALVGGEHENRQSQGFGLVKSILGGGKEDAFSALENYIQVFNSIVLPEVAGSIADRAQSGPETKSGMFGV